MILFELKCSKGHKYQAWFKSNQSYEEQLEKKIISCPVCGDNDVCKAPMSPYIAKSRTKKTESSVDIKKNDAGNVQAEMVERLNGAMEKLKKAVEENCDYVGEEFPEEARKMHYGETEERNIYGEASLEDVKELKEEGIDVMPVPMQDKKNN